MHALRPLSAALLRSRIAHLAAFLFFFFETRM